MSQDQRQFQLNKLLSTDKQFQILNDQTGHKRQSAGQGGSHWGDPRTK